MLIRGEATLSAPMLAETPRPLLAEEIYQHPKMGRMPKYSNVYRISDQVVAKFGPRVHQGEAETLRLLERQGIPAPKVLDAYVEPTTGYYLILMEYVEGTALDLAFDSFSELEKETVVRQLKGHINRLRSTSGNFIGSFDQANVKDAFFSNPCQSGPYQTEEEFVDGLVGSLKARGGEGQWTELIAAFIKALPKHSPCYPLTNGDLNPRNILVRGTEVVAILDWSQAGFYPEHWEFVKACLWDLESCFFTEGLVWRILTPYVLELGALAHARDLIW